MIATVGKMFIPINMFIYFGVFRYDGGAVQIKKDLRNTKGAREGQAKVEEKGTLLTGTKCGAFFSPPWLTRADI